MRDALSRTLTGWIATSVAALLIVAPAAAQEPTPLSGDASAVSTASAPLRCSHRWLGHEHDIETFMREAPIVRFEDIPIGVTKPRRGYFAAGSPVGSVAWKVLRPVARRGYEESHKAEVAAYRLSRLLEMHMVPPVVERKVGRELGAAVMWIENVRRWDVRKPPAIPMRDWSRQVSRMKMFDQLIANIDRNQGNLLHDEDGHLFLIDHSRAFTTRTSLKNLDGPSQVCRTLWMRIEALTRDDIQAAVGDALTSPQIDALLKRRDAMRKQIDTLVRTRGDAIAFLPAPAEDSGVTAEAMPRRLPGA